MKQFFSVLFLFVLLSGLSFAQDAADVNLNQPVKIDIPDGQNVPTPFESDFALLFDNGPLITHPAGGAGGNDASAVQTALLNSLYGFGAQLSASNSMADDFTVPGAGWNIDEMQFFTYQTNSGNTSTINDLRVQIYNGPPNAGGTVVWGDFTTNRLTSTTWTTIYRVLDTDLLNTARPVMVAVAQFATPISLAAGTYWVEFQFGGTAASGPWAPPVTILNATGKPGANALQKTSTGWAPAIDAGSGSAQDVPFLIMGTESGAAVEFFDDFEAYTAGIQLCLQTTNWEPWVGSLPGSAADPFVSNLHSYSGSNSIVIVSNNDVVRRHGPKTSGIWYISFLFYIPSGKSGYFNTMNGYDPVANVWGMDSYFDVGGTGRLDTTGGGGTGSTNVNFAWTPNQWNQVVVVVDLDATPPTAQYWLGTSQANFTQIATWGWTQAGAKPNELHVNDLFGAAATDEMYVDDFYFDDELPAIIPVELTSFTGNVNNLGQVILNWETATEINNHGFEIERRTETSEFRTVAFVEGYGTTTEPKSYSYLDKTAEQGVNYYRLKQVDFNGTYSYSDEVEVDVTGPLTFDLAQNYPNPFNPSTSIKYSVPESGNIRLSVFNIVGEEVAVLAEGFAQAGFYEVTFDASNLSTGVYLYKLQSANSVQTKKMMLLK
jgi:hypothetical protein